MCIYTYSIRTPSEFIICTWLTIGDFTIHTQCTQLDCTARPVLPQICQFLISSQGPAPNVTSFQVKKKIHIKLTNFQRLYSLFFLLHKIQYKRAKISQVSVYTSVLKVIICSDFIELGCTKRNHDRFQPYFPMYTRVPLFPSLIHTLTRSHSLSRSHTHTHSSHSISSSLLPSFSDHAHKITFLLYFALSFSLSHSYYSISHYLYTDRIRILTQSRRLFVRIFLPF